METLLFGGLPAQARLLNPARPSRPPPGTGEGPGAEAEAGAGADAGAGMPPERLAFAAPTRHCCPMEPEIERDLRQTHDRIAGVDEVGRGPWAGPVTAAAVVLDPARIPEGLRDSKALSAGRRRALALEIHASAEVAIVHVGVEVIDRINILQASLLAMRQALEQLHPPPGMALIDGRHLPADLPCPGRALIKGDARAESIAAASIVAKVARDEMMVALSQQHPGYGWERNAGYGTAAHSEGLRQHGVTPHHRRSFKPIHNILSAKKMPTR